MVMAPVCPRCQTPAGRGDFCTSCGLYLGDPTGTVEKVTFTRRFFGNYLLEGLLFLLTLIVGWFVWLFFTARTAQTPAKRLVHTYVLNKETGRPVSAGRMWVREVLVKMVLAAFANSVIGVWWLADGLWVFFGRNRQALHDLIGVGQAMQTLVVYAPGGLSAEFGQRATGAPPAAGGAAQRLRELARLRDEGLISEEEYEERRRKLVEEL